MDYRYIDVQPIAGALGAEIGGVDLALSLDDDVFDEIRQAFHENLVIFFRDQKITPDQHKDFGCRFGALSIHPHYAPIEGHPEILPINKGPKDESNLGGRWHTDMSFLAAPVLGSILYAIDVPASGGDTMFSNQYLAYDALSAGMQEMLDGMTAVHSDRSLTTPAEAETRNKSRSIQIRPEAMTGKATVNEHPVVRTHVDTGQKCLYVNRSYVSNFSGMSEAESEPLLRFLYAHSVRPEFTCRFRWAANSIAFWDNRCTQHYALDDYPGQRRIMNRVTVDGERPV